MGIVRGDGGQVGLGRRESENPHLSSSWEEELIWRGEGLGGGWPRRESACSQPDSLQELE